LGLPSSLRVFAFDVEILLIASPKAMIVRRRSKRKCLMSTITLIMILIKYPVDSKILKKYRNLSHKIRLIVAYMHDSRVGAALSSKTPRTAKGRKIVRRMGGIRSK